MVKNEFIPVNEPVISKESKKYVNNALNTGWVSSSGPYVSKFEEKFAEYLGVKFGVAVSSGTGALHVALLALGIGEGDEVIVPAFTMASVWMAVLYTGATPVFVDCEKDNFNIDPSLVEAKISKNTKAIIPVHIYGHAVDMDPVMKLARKHKLKVIEDAAEAHGAEYKSKKCGSFGDISCFSFYANKIITMGEGGIVLTNNRAIAEKAKKLRDLFHSDKKRFIHDGLGYNYRLTNLQAAMGCGELENIDKYLEKKNEISRLYNKLLNEVPGIRLPKTQEYAVNVFWMYAILIDSSKFGVNRDSLRKKLGELGVGTRDFFYPPSKQPILKRYVNVNSLKKYPNSELISKQGMYLPSGLAITKSQIRKVVSSIKKIHKEVNG